MVFPKVEFQSLDIEENLDTLVWYLKKENSVNSPLNFYELTMKLFPELEGKILEQMNDEEIYQILDVEIRPILEKLEKESKDIERCQKIWDKINDSVMADLENRLGITWNSQKTIIGGVCLLPVCARDTTNWTFDVNYGIPEDDLIETVIHELCHFLYFEKWKKMYSEYQESEFSPPHLVWYLSEAMIDPLLNNEIFQKYTHKPLLSYAIFYDTLVEGQSIIHILRQYMENYSIEEAIQRGYELFQAYESLIHKE